MALIKDIMTDKKIVAQFWIIPKIEKDRYNKSAYILMYGYINQKQCDDGGIFLDRKFYNVYADKFDDYFSLDILKQEGVCEYDKAYEFIKDNIEEFKEAVDLIVKD